MVMMVHITTAEKARAIKRAGLRSPRDGAIFAMPVTPNFVLTHQWTRELQKWSRQPMVAVYFRVPDDLPVQVGVYNKEKTSMTAAQAAAHVLMSATLGLEIEIPGSVPPKQIHAIRNLRSVIGWRHYPGAHGQRPFCGCSYCMRGVPGGRKLRDAYNRH